MTEPETIICLINGKEFSLPEGTTLLDFLKMKSVSAGAVVIERNKQVLPRGQYDGVMLIDGDTVEIIQIIGGG